MKHLLIILILTGSCFAINSDPNEMPYYEIDPNDTITTVDTITFTVQITVPRKQYRALNYLEMTILDMFRRSTFGRLWDRVLPQARTKATKNMDIDDLRAKIER